VRAVLATDAALVRTAEPSERARVQDVLEHLLPVSARVAGIRFDLVTAALTEPYAIDRIECPILTVSSEDDGFGTAARARRVAQVARRGRAVVYRTGGHALVGRYAAALEEVRMFLSSCAADLPDRLASTPVDAT
jgi:hypothetical protein